MTRAAPPRQQLIPRPLGHQAPGRGAHQGRGGRGLLHPRRPAGLGQLAVGARGGGGGWQDTSLGGGQGGNGRRTWRRRRVEGAPSFLLLCVRRCLWPLSRLCTRSLAPGRPQVHRFRGVRASVQPQDHFGVEKGAPRARERSAPAPLDPAYGLRPDPSSQRRMEGGEGRTPQAAGPAPRPSPFSQPARLRSTEGSEGPGQLNGAAEVSGGADGASACRPPPQPAQRRVPLWCAGTHTLHAARGVSHTAARLPAAAPRLLYRDARRPLLARALAVCAGGDQTRLRRRLAAAGAWQCDWLLLGTAQHLRQDAHTQPPGMRASCS